MPVNIAMVVFPLTPVVPDAVAIPGSAVELTGMVLVPGKKKASAFGIPALADVINTKSPLEICL